MKAASWKGVFQRSERLGLEKFPGKLPAHILLATQPLHF